MSSSEALESFIITSPGHCSWLSTHTIKHFYDGLFSTNKSFFRRWTVTHVMCGFICEVILHNVLPPPTNEHSCLISVQSVIMIGTFICDAGSPHESESLTEKFTSWGNMFKDEIKPMTVFTCESTFVSVWVEQINLCFLTACVLKCVCFCVVLPSMRTSPDGFCGAEHLNVLAQSLRANEVRQSRHHLSG